MLADKEREVTKWNLCFVIQMVGIVTEAAVLKSNAFQWQKNSDDKVWWKRSSLFEL